MKVHVDVKFMVALACFAAAPLGCSSSARPDDDGADSGGSGGDEDSGGGAAGTGSDHNGGTRGGAGEGGGRAPGNKGGSGGVAGTGGGAGKATGGATAGEGGTSAKGGSGGAGGSAGMPAGGSGGTAPPPVAGEGPFLFTGRDMALVKLVDADAAAGYFYSGGDSGVEGTVHTLSDAEKQGLPAGIQYALRASATSTGLTILGVNLRADDGQKWRYFDASGYAGLMFWGRTAQAAAIVNTTVVDAENVPMTAKEAGECTETDKDLCKPVAGRESIWMSSWKQFKLSWDDLASGGPVAPSKIARIDWLSFQMNDLAAFMITGVQLATAQDLAN